MKQATFAGEIAHMEKAIAAAKIRSFGMPHLIVDDLLPNDLLRRINDNWPAADSFQAEVPGNYIARLYRNDYGNIAPELREFWATFNESLWPLLLASCAQAMAGPALGIFGDLYEKVLALDGDWPLTLMQADATYPGHEAHTHFYHAPHWVFTILIYIDSDDTSSNGTDIQRLKSRSSSVAHEDISSYQMNDLDWRVDVAMSTFKWHLPEVPLERREVKYRANRMFLMLDGPLALHSVAFDQKFIPNLERAEHAATKGRRRILRSHVKVHHTPFYKRHSEMLSKQLEPARFMRVMARDAILSPADMRYREDVVRPFYRERLTAYAHAAQLANEAHSRSAAAQMLQALWRRLNGERPTDKYLVQLADRVPVKGWDWSPPESGV